MPRNMFWKKGLVVGIILLFVLMSVFPSTANHVEKTFMPTSRGKTLYVGGSGEGNYSRIQDAVDNASDGDTVFVYSGIYSDYFPEYLACVHIEKRINLVGEDKYSTIINGSGEWHAVWIKANGVNITGFTIQNTGSESQRGNGITISYGKDVLISNNIITKTLGGIRNNGVSSKICNNILSNNKVGISLGSGTSNYVFENLISNNSKGIDDWEADFSDVKSNTIYKNIIRDNNMGLSVTGRRKTIRCNNFINNNDHSYFYHAYPVTFGRQNWIRNYWDDWNSTSPRKIKGEWAIYLIWWMSNWYPCSQFDWFPAKEPYDIQ